METLWAKKCIANFFQLESFIDKTLSFHLAKLMVFLLLNMLLLYFMYVI